jgi:hypothetical protein
MAGDFSDLYDDYGVPPIDLDDQSAIQGALGAAQVPAAPVTPTTAAPLSVDDLLAAVPADWRAQAAPPPAVDPLDDLPATTPAPTLPAPEDLAPDFSRTDYARALDALTAPRVDPTQAAQAAADAERTLGALETRQGSLQASVVERAREIDQIDAQIASARQIPDAATRKARLADLDEQRTATAGALEMDRAAYQQLGAEVQTAQRARQSARRSYQDELAVADREGQVLAVAAETAAMQAAQAEDERILREAQAREAELQQEQAEAQRQLVDDRRAYRDVLERGPEATGKQVALAVASVLGELLMARAHGGRPDLTRAIAGVEAATKDDFQRRLQARMAAIQDTGDAITRAGREREVHRAETAARRAEVYGAIERELETRLAQGRTLSQQATYIAARDDVRAAREAEEAQLLAANAKLARERRRDDLEMAKLAAETSLAQRKAMGGTGGPAATAAAGARTNISETALVDPVSGAVLGESRFTERGKVREDQDTIRSMSDTLTEMQEYVNMLANTGRVYQGVGAKAVKGSDVARLEAKHSKLLADIIRAYSGAAATDAEVERLKKVLPGPKSYTDMGAWDPAQVVRDYRDTHSRIYENFLGSRLTTGFTTIRDERGQPLPTSPTYGWRAERGDAPIRTTVGDIVVDLNQDNETEFDRRLAGWVNRAAGGQDRAKILEGMESAADALKATGQTDRAKLVREARKQVEQGETRQTADRSFPATVGEPTVRIRHKGGAIITQPASWWERNAASLGAEWELLE